MGTCPNPLAQAGPLNLIHYLEFLLLRGGGFAQQVYAVG